MWAVLGAVLVGVLVVGMLVVPRLVRFAVRQRRAEITPSRVPADLAGALDQVIEGLTGKLTDVLFNSELRAVITDAITQLNAAD